MDYVDHVALLNEACLGNDSAVKLLIGLGKIFRTWDNAWDGDKPVSALEFDQAFSDLAFGLNCNEFFRKHRDVIESQIFLSWNAWQDSNAWKNSSDSMQSLCAWFIRDYCNELVQLVSFLIGGKDHARSISLKVRAAYLKELSDGGIDGFIQFHNRNKD